MNDQQNGNPDVRFPGPARPGGPRHGRAIADKALTASTIVWFAVAWAGQAIFAVYIALFYGGTTIRGDMNAWNEILPNRVVDGDAAGIAAIGAHMVLAFIVTVAGPFQLVPGLRARLPVLHHWTGRLYLLAAYAISLGGLYLIWGRRDADDTLPGLAPLTLNALLIMIFAAMTVKNAMARRIDVHRQWALRLFLAMSGVWFLRVGIMIWILAFGTDGLGGRLEGPIGTFLKFACYAIPLAMLELYFATRRSDSTTFRWAMTGILFVLTGAMAAGIGMATVALWLPHM